MKLLDAFRHRVNGIMTFIILVSLCILNIFSFYAYHSGNTQYESDVEMVNELARELRADFMVTMYDLAEQRAMISAKQTADELRRDIQSQYPNLDVLRAELESGSLENSKLPEIVYKGTLNKNIYDIRNSRNDTFILVRDGYVMDHNIYDYDTSWHTFDQETNIDAVKAFRLLDSRAHTNDEAVIYSSSENDRYGHANTLNVIVNRIELRNLFVEKGIDGLRDYEFHGVAYINEDDDIFNTPDIASNGALSSNHKIIVVQKFNLYDIMTTRYGEYLDATDQWHTRIISNLTEKNIKRGITYLIFTSMSLIVMSVFIIGTTVQFKRSLFGKFKERSTD